MNIKNNILHYQKELARTGCKLIAVSKTKPIEALIEAYEAGVKDFGENKVQELVEKQELLPSDITWHMIGHLQRNKVKYIAPFIGLIHAVDSQKLLKEIDKEGKKNNRVIPCLLQIYIAAEETKFGLSEDELRELLASSTFESMNNIKITGFMGMATFTDNANQIRKEFQSLQRIFEDCKAGFNHKNLALQELSMGMSNDYKIAIEEGSTMVRIGSAIFGAR